MKKSLLFGLLALLILVLIAGCQTNDNLIEETYTIPEYPPDVIDWNMYSWVEDEEWVFSIVDRSAGYDQFEQISAEEFDLVGINQLMDALTMLPENSEVFWSGYIIAGTTMPPQDLVYEILNLSNALGVPILVLD